MNGQKIVGLVICMYLCLLPAAARAQTAVTGAIAGTVKDTSGAVLPGVTVEAASPALIERVRVVVTDDQGLYRIVDLRPGIYTVTFALPGFRSLRREGLELATGFTATVNADLAVGTLEETVTVSGATPVVDISNVRTQAVITRDLLNALPVSRTFVGYFTLMAGVSLPATRQDVGGAQGEVGGAMTIHGNRGNDMIINSDGMRIQRGGQGGGFSSWGFNQASVQEITFQTSGIAAESETSGIQMNVVPKEGGNNFSGYGAANFANSGMQSKNVNDELVNRGLDPNSTLKIEHVYDFNIALGGPIKQDKLWFFTAHREWGTTRPLPAPGDYFNKNDGTDQWFVYQPDFSRPHLSRIPHRSHNIRLTWQAAQKHKLALSFEYQPSCVCPQIYAGLIAPEATAFHPYMQHVSQIAWSNPVTNRLLFDAGFTYYHWDFLANENDGVGPDAIAVNELSNGLTMNARAFANTVFPGRSYGRILENQFNGRFAVSYVTGSHNLKLGTSWLWSGTDQWARTHGDVLYTFLNAVPSSITQFATPAVNDGRAFATGIYAQDQWIVQKLTLNLGVRFDYLNGWNPAMSAPAGTWVPARTYPRTENLPNFKDVSPRLGAAYDLFGNGKTALKASVGRYVGLSSTTFAVANSPSQLEEINTTRTWTDINRDFVPQEIELGPSSNVAFGTQRSTTHLADEVHTGFGNRDYNWQISASLQQELRPGVALNTGYFRTWYGNQTVTDNLAVAPADYDQFCITAPVDARLPSDVSGSRICGLYDINPTKFGQVNNLLTFAEHFGKRTEVYNGGEIGLTGRLPNGGQLSGGLSTGRTDIDNCSVVDSPEVRFCKTTMSFASQTQIKLFGSYPLPWDFGFSATFQDLPGIPITADYVVTSAAIAPSLGRPLAAGARATRTVALIDSNAIREDRRRQLDVRLSRTFRVGRTSVLGTFEVFNALNGNAVLQMTTRYGAAWLRPSEIVVGRLLKVGTQVTF